MAAQDQRTIDPDDIDAKGVHWDIATLLDGAADVDELLDSAGAIAAELSRRAAAVLRRCQRPRLPRSFGATPSC